MYRHSRPSLAPFLLGAGVGATAMCLLDPNMGRRRRAILQDKTRHYTHIARSGAGKATRDLGNRMAGARHRATTLLQPEHAPDEVISERVRAALGHVTRHPRAIDVHVENGVVRLSGAVAEGEAERLVRGTEHVRGVKRVESRLEARAAGEEAGPATPPPLPERQSRRAGLGARPSIGRATRAVLGARQQLAGGRATQHVRRLAGNGRQVWNPSTRALSAVAGAAGLAWAVARRTPGSAAAGAAGAALLARSALNRPMSNIVGARDRGDAVRVRKTLAVEAPIEQVYRLWSHPELFPRFLPHLKSVRRLGNGRFRWVAAGPGGMEVDWEAEMTEDEPGRKLSWRTVEGSTVENHGAVHFEREGDGRTRIHVDMSYGPPAGLLGHSFARLTRRDPRTLMNDDLLRMKSLLEDGATTARGEVVRLEEILPSA